jgi:hypothetical protein
VIYQETGQVTYFPRPRCPRRAVPTGSRTPLWAGLLLPIHLGDATEGSEYQPFEDVSHVPVSHTTTDQFRHQLTYAVTDLVNGLKPFAQYITP